MPLLRCLDLEDYGRACREAALFTTPSIAWDPLLRAATAALAGKDKVAAVAHREFTEMFPEVAEDPERISAVSFTPIVTSRSCSKGSKWLQNSLGSSR